MNVVITQAMASGLPIVATRHSGIPDQVDDGHSGFLVPEGDVEALARAMLEMLSNPGRWPEFGRRGRAIALARFDSRVLVEKQIDMYRDLAAAARGARRSL